MVFYIGGKTKEQWEQVLYSEFTQSKYDLDMSQNEMTDEHIKFPIEFTVDTIFSTLERYKLDPYKQYQLAIGFNNACSCSEEKFRNNKASFITNHDSIRRLYLKNERMTRYVADSYEIDLPDDLEKYANYISSTINNASQDIIKEFQQKDVSQEVKDQYERQYRASLGEMTHAERVLERRGDAQDKKSSLKWAEAVVSQTHSFNPSSPSASLSQRRTSSDDTSSSPDRDSGEGGIGR